MGKTILITEDENVLRAVLRERLEDEGFTVIEAKNGKECLTYLKDNTPDLLLLDISMPDINGTEVLNTINESGLIDTIPIIVLTNLADMNTISEVMSNKVFKYIVKSDHSLAEIVAAVHASAPVSV